MLDDYKSSMSTVRESCKSTELKRCIATEMRWSKYEVSLTSPDWEEIRRPSSTSESSVDELSVMRFWTATIIIIIIITIITRAVNSVLLHDSLTVDILDL